MKICFKIECKHLCGHLHTHTYFRKLSPKELRQEEDKLFLQPCPDCASKPFSEWDSKVVKKRGGYRPGAGRPTALGQGQTTTIRIPLKYKEQVLNYVKCLSERERVDDVPFGPPPEEFNYRCSRCPRLSHKNLAHFLNLQ
jgi:hypothetical protein